MKWRRSLGAVLVFLLMSGSVMGSEPAKLLQVRWSELGKTVRGKRVTLQLAEGGRVEGRVRKVTATSLVVKVKKSSNPAAYPKGKIQVPREAVSRIEARSPKIVRVGRETRRVGLTAGAFAGALLGGVAVVFAVSDSDGSQPDIAAVAVVGAATAAAVFVYKALAPKGVILIEILPDSPGASMPKSKNEDESSNTTAEPSPQAPERFREKPGPLTL